MEAASGAPTCGHAAQEHSEAEETPRNCRQGRGKEENFYIVAPAQERTATVALLLTTALLERFKNELPVAIYRISLKDQLSLKVRKKIETSSL